MFSILALTLSLAAGGDAKEVKIQAQAAWPFTRAGDMVRKGAATFVIRSDAELLKASGLVGDGRSRIQLATFLKKAFKVDKIDYDTQTLVVITAGTQSSGGFSVEATKATSDGKDVTIAWKLNRPKGFTISVLTHPAAIILIDRVPGEVRFDPPVGDKRRRTDGRSGTRTLDDPPIGGI